MIVNDSKQIIIPLLSISVILSLYGIESKRMRLSLFLQNNELYNTASSLAFSIFDYESSINYEKRYCL